MLLFSGRHDFLPRDWRIFCCGERFSVAMEPWGLPQRLAFETRIIFVNYRARQAHPQKNPPVPGKSRVSQKKVTSHQKNVLSHEIVDKKASGSS